MNTSYTYEYEKDAINGFIQDYSRSNLVKNKQKQLVSNRALRLKSVPTVSRSLYIHSDCQRAHECLQPSVKVLAVTIMLPKFFVFKIF